MVVKQEFLDWLKKAPKGMEMTRCLVYKNGDDVPILDKLNEELYKRYEKGEESKYAFKIYFQIMDEEWVEENDEISETQI